MTALFPRFGQIALLLFFVFSTTTVTAATYTVGGEGADYPTLEALRTSSRLQDGDTIVLNGDDNSLTTEFYSDNFIFQGTGKISPAPSGNRLVNGTLTLDSDSLEFTGFRGYSGGVARATTNITGGTNTFTGNSAGLYGGAIYGITTISGGTNTFVGNSSASYGGAIYGDTIITGGTNIFSDNNCNTNGSGIRGGAAILADSIDITGGTNTFSNNSSLYYANTYDGTPSSWGSVGHFPQHIPLFPVE